MEQERGAGLHRVLIVAEARQAMGDEIVQRAQRIGARHRPAEFLEPAEMIGKAALDERDHLARHLIRREAQPSGRNRTRPAGACGSAAS